MRLHRIIVSFLLCALLAGAGNAHAARTFNLYDELGRALSGSALIIQLKETPEITIEDGTAADSDGLRNGVIILSDDWWKNHLGGKEILSVQATAEGMVNAQDELGFSPTRKSTTLSLRFPLVVDLRAMKISGAQLMMNGKTVATDGGREDADGLPNGLIYYRFAFMDLPSKTGPLKLLGTQGELLGQNTLSPSPRGWLWKFTSEGERVLKNP